MDEDGGGRPVAAAVKHRGPEQAVKVEDVLADEVVQLGVAVRSPEVVEGDPLAVAELTEARHVADRCVDPDVEVLVRCIRDLEAEVRRVARDVPVPQPVVEPLAELVHHLALQAAVADPLLEQVPVVGQAQEEVLGLPLDRQRSGDDGTRVDQVRRLISRAALVATVTVLVLRPATRTGSLDEAVGQEHLPFGVIELPDRPAVDRPPFPQPAVYSLHQFPVLGRVGGVEVVEVDLESAIVLQVLRRQPDDQVLGRDSLPLGAQHDRRAVRVLGTDVVALVTTHPLHPAPDVRLDRFHQVAHVDRTVGVGQAAGDQDASSFRHFVPCRFLRKRSWRFPRRSAPGGSGLCSIRCQRARG